VSSVSAVNSRIKLFPVIELLDIYYAYKYGWLSELLEVSDGVMLRPGPELGEALGSAFP